MAISATVKKDAQVPDAVKASAQRNSLSTARTAKAAARGVRAEQNSQAEKDEKTIQRRHAARRAGAARRAKAERRAKRAANRSSVLTTVVVMLLLFIAGLQLVQIRTRINTAEAAYESLAAQVAEQQKTNAALEAALQHANDPAFLQELARDQFDMVSPGQKDFYDTSK